MTTFDRSFLRAAHIASESEEPELTRRETGLRVQLILWRFIAAAGWISFLLMVSAWREW